MALTRAAPLVVKTVARLVVKKADQMAAVMVESLALMLAWTMVGRWVAATAELTAPVLVVHLGSLTAAQTADAMAAMTVVMTALTTVAC